MIKIFFKFLLFIIATNLIFGCASEEPLLNSNEEKIFLHLNIERNLFDDDFSSRSVSDGWSNQDKLFFRFTSGNSTIIGNATYAQPTQYWDLEIEGSLSPTSDGQVEVFYFGSNDVEYLDYKIPLTAYNPVYADYNGRYSLNEDGELVISAVIKPLTSRIFVKGTSNTIMAIAGFEHISSFNVKSGKIEYSNNFTEICITTEGRSNYIYGIHNNDKREIVITKQENDKNFYAYTFQCTGTTFSVGHSGWLNVPTFEAYAGWSRKCLNGISDGHKWIDLGLPSGIKWSIENVGADYEKWLTSKMKSDIYGDWYSWGSSDPDNYKLVAENYNFEDVAMLKWGKNWKIPTENDVDELISNCTYEWIFNCNNSGINGGVLTSKLYGTSIFIPAAGYWLNLSWSDGGYQYEGEYGNFWTTTSNSNTGASYASVGEKSIWTSSSGAKSHRWSVRPICN